MNIRKGNPPFRRETVVNGFHIFVIRAFLGVAFAVVMSRFFFQKINFISVAGLAVFLVGMAYLLEYYRKKKSG